MPEAATQVLAQASAPGKMVLAGEYAVLDGAPAICMAVNRRARVTVSATGDGTHTVSAPGYSMSTGRFRGRADGIEWLSGGDDFALVDALWRAANPLPKGGLAIHLDSREFSDPASGAKVGFGSSAALAVALAHALCHAAATDAEPTRVAFAAHRHLQDGLGSGVDIACSAAGGLIEYSMSAVSSRRCRWPAGLEMGVVWVGVPVSTRDKLMQLRRQEARPSSAALVLASRRLAAAWNNGAVEAVLEEYRDYTSVLGEFSTDHELGIFDAGHAELAEVAREAGIVYKPCGAGGGDTGVALATDRTAIEAFLGTAADMGYRPLDVEIDATGASLDAENL